MNEPLSNVPRIKLQHSRVSNGKTDLLDESTFQTMLSLERKRAERSSRSFVLMLIEPGHLLMNGNGTRVLHHLSDSLSHCTRETDIKGWYQTGLVLGVIFTEIGVDGGTVVNSIERRVSKALDAGDLNREDIRVSFFVFPEDSEKHDSIDFKESPLYPDLKTERKRRQGDRFLKRLMDIAGSLFALLVFSPFLAVIAIAVRFSSKGPILFKQERVGQFGKSFLCLKFRSMYHANDDAIHQEYVKRLIAGSAGTAQSGDRQQPVYKLTRDPRITPLGRFLRRTSLDELPQFLNVLKGEMSLVGPRPPVLYEFECYSTWQRRRLLEVKPGITGAWQVGGRSKVKFEDMVRMDLQYARNWNLWLDIKILLKTPRAAITGL